MGLDIVGINTDKKTQGLGGLIIPFLVGVILGFYPTLFAICDILTQVIGELILFRGALILSNDPRVRGANVPNVSSGNFIVKDSFDLRPSSLSGPISGSVLGNDQILFGNVKSTYTE